MNNIVIVVLILVGGIAGYFIGSHEGKEAIKTLDRVRQASTIAGEEHRNTLKALDERLAGLTREHQAKALELEAGFDRQRAVWEALRSGYDRRIRELNEMAATSQKQVADLRGELSVARDPAEREKLLARMAQLQRQIKDHDARVLSEQCLKVPVPAQVVKAVSGAGT